MLAVTVLALVVAVIALGVGVFALTRTHTTKPERSDVPALAKEVRALKTELAAADSAAFKSQGEVTESQGELTKVKNEMARFRTCVPELMSQIRALNIETSYREVGLTDYLTSAYLSPGKALSTYCQTTLEGPTHP